MRAAGMGRGVVGLGGGGGRVMLTAAIAEVVLCYRCGTADRVRILRLLFSLINFFFFFFFFFF